MPVEIHFQFHRLFVKGGLTMGKPHALVIPLPAQGHVRPLMDFSHCLADHGFKITFANTEFNHNRLMASLVEMGGSDGDHRQIHLVSIPDGLAPGEDKTDLRNVCESALKHIPVYLEELIAKINENEEEDQITCIVADAGVAWAVEIAEKMGIVGVVFCPASAAMLALLTHLPNLVDAGLIDANGFPIKQQMIKLTPTMPEINIDELVWLGIGDEELQKFLYQYYSKIGRVAKSAKWLVCNSFYEIEQSAFSLSPNARPIGPLVARNKVRRLEGSFWPEDSTCLSWLDKQPACSVIYAAFGSFTVFDKYQFHELALGLELSGRPFLWVVRPDLTDNSSEAYPDGFIDRVIDRGQMVSWSPQWKVLGHPSIACFLTHCGWNSTMEGLSNAVPFICWPYFADQFINQTLISEIWKVGVRLKADNNGIISKEEIKGKIEELLGDKGIKVRSLKLKEMARKSVAQGGSSAKNFEEFIEAIKC